MQTKQLIGALVGVALLGTLTACSSAATHGGTPSHSASATASTGTAATKTAYGKCIDGQATILASSVAKGKSFVLRGDCDAVSIVGAAKPHTAIHLPDIKHLVIEGDNTTVDVTTADTIIVPGSHNTVTHGGKPDVQDQGTGNSITARK